MLTRKRFLKDLANLLTLSLIVAAGATVASGQAAPVAETGQAPETPSAATPGNSQETAVAKVDAKAKPAAEKSDPAPATPTPTLTPQIVSPCRDIISANVVALPQ